MRADRLVSILLLLQQRGHVTAAEVAAEVEVSERTARRDLEALGMAGLPVYATRGQGGGYRLAGGGRTDLSGLNAAEARALFLVAGPSSTATPELRTALRKLVRALPEPFRDAADRVGSAIVVDRGGWDRRGRSQPAPPPLLDEAQRLVVEGRQAVLSYVARDRRQSDRVVEPLGLAAQGTTWYLVADTTAGRRTFRVDRIVSLVETGEPATRPDDFDLAVAWAAIGAEVDRVRTPVVAEALLDADSLPISRYLLGTRLAIGASAPDGRVHVEVRGHSAEILGRELAGFGHRIEVTAPDEVRHELARIGRALSDRYGAPPDA